MSQDSAYLMDMSGNVVISRNTDLYKSVSAMTIPTNYSDNVVSKNGQKVYDHPFDRNTFLTALYSNAYRLRCCKVKADYKAGTAYSVTPSTPKIEEFLNGLGWKDYFIWHLNQCVLDYECYGDYALAIYKDAAGAVQYISRVDSKNVYVLETGGFVEICWKNKKQYNNFYKDFYASAAEKAIQKGDLKEGGTVEMIRKIKRNNLSSIYGIPDDLACWEAVVGASLIAEYQNSVLGNMSAPAYLVIVKNGSLDADQEEAIKTVLKNNKGTKNAGRTGVLKIQAGSEVEIRPILPAQQEGSYLELDRSFMKKIISAHGVPPAKVELIETGALAGEATYEQYQEFIDACQFERGSIVEDVMDDILRAAGYAVEYLGVYSENAWNSSLMNVLAVAYQNNFITPNQAAKRLGIDTVDDEISNMKKDEYQGWLRQLELTGGEIPPDTPPVDGGTGTPPMDSGTSTGITQQ